jgi:ribonuclease T2
MLDIMPSKKLVFQQYRKHGTCAGLGVDAYFGLARRLYDKVSIPQRYVRLTDDRLLVGPGELVGEFLDANPELRPDMIAVQCGGSGNRLREVRICFTKGGDFRSCGPNENQGRLCSADRMYIPPVRHSLGSKDLGGPNSPPREIVPLPK